jgi:superfamily I DNA and/or RNA helicase
LKTIQKPEENIETVLEKAIEDIYRISIPGRHSSLKYWMIQIFSQTGREIFELLKSGDERKQDERNAYGEIDKRCLQDADVIGLTTAEFAHRISVLWHIKAKVTICEEAGQILEGHLLPALLPSLEHLIQIGDHSQLRPPINDYRLSVEGPYSSHYQLDRSMFERLSIAKPGRISQSLLNVQRRMRPDISRLLKGTIYPELLDHESVKTIQLWLE